MKVDERTKAIANAMYTRLLMENDIELVNEMLYVYGFITFNVITARIRRRNNRDFIRRADIRFPWTEYNECMQYKREIEREMNPQHLRRGHI